MVRDEGIRLRRTVNQKTMRVKGTSRRGGLKTRRKILQRRHAGTRERRIHNKSKASNKRVLRRGRRGLLRQQRDLRWNRRNMSGDTRRSFLTGTRVQTRARRLRGK